MNKRQTIKRIIPESDVHFNFSTTHTPSLLLHEKYPVNSIVDTAVFPPEPDRDKDKPEMNARPVKKMNPLQPASYHQAGIQLLNRKAGIIERFSVIPVNPGVGLYPEKTKSQIHNQPGKNLPKYGWQTIYQNAA